MVNLDGFQLVLGSGSPRRKELLERMGFDIQIRPAQADESYPHSLAIQDIPKFLAKKKAQVLLETLNSREILITSDTIVVLGNELLEKPDTPDQAKEMLLRLSSKSHQVQTGVCLTSLTTQHCFNDTSMVWFNELSEKEIDYYIEKYQPFDKAGAYGIQEWIGLIGIERIEGSFYTIMGLPTSILFKELNRFIQELKKG
jgi:septum formation protein